MRILHVVQLYHPVASGAARYFREIGERLAAEGHRVTVLATDACDLEHIWMPGRRCIETPFEMLNGVQIVRLPIRRRLGLPIFYPALRRLMTEISRIANTAPLLRRLALWTPQWPGVETFFAQYGPFDLVHATNITLDFAILPAFAYAQQHRIPFICTPFVHLGEPGSRTIVRYYSMRHQIDLLCRSDRVIVMTGLERDFLAARGVPRERLRVVGVGVTPEEVQGGDGARFRADHCIDGPLVLFIGALAYDKGAIHLVRAMQRLWRDGYTATLALIGAPLAHFNAFYTRLPAADRARIRLLPYAPETIKRDALAAADVFALPSRTDSFGIVFLEAWCYGVPVIGARAGGIPDVIIDGQDGLLVRFGDVAGLAQTIRLLLDDRPLAQRLGAAGRAKTLRDLTWERVYARARAVYAEVGVV
ncbi:MAG: glycosyltransferase family 4 protein [Roseiflexus sp.]|nr:glycosyltransferase family 4 protein [Roseiflexus sp.]MCS7289230.1 glycosyltransferase family 4 protein [Roseiflexus sp.]MDW8146709.1 glycosyltransferase family 4 protein [Roseiflexaceae bacterium]MDW8232643.1 glycosyltransferase family 4 protein [Roseiflexaceae bacterium]